ncbi:MAG TPA: hypothetical protein VJU60_02730 [Thermoleophilaceae bacterium]|nr:hypothetical protein [Thermoleophilaceae bacterium]
MAEQHDWLSVSLDARVRDELASAVAAVPNGNDDVRTHLMRVLRSSRSDLLLDRAQGALVLRAITTQRQLPALKARLEAFLNER